MLLKISILLLLSPCFLSYTNTGKSMSFYSTSGYQIRDLWEDAATDIASWTIGSHTTPNTLNCNGRTILGYGLNRYQSMSRTYNGLGTHNRLLYVLSVWFLDSSEASDYLTVNLGGTTYTLTIPNNVGTSDFVDYCSRGHAEIGEYILYVVLPHSLSSTYITIYNGHNEDPPNEAIGISSITITAINQTYDYAYIIHRGPIVIDLSRYTYYSGFTSSSSCTTGNCALCYTNDQFSCIACPMYGFYFEQNRCYACDSTCKVCTTATNCFQGICAANEYLYKNNSCLTTCEYPFTIAANSLGSDRCNFLCGTDYLWFNGTCTASCPSPFSARTSYTYKYCDENPCKYTTLSTRTYYESVSGNCISCPVFCAVCYSGTNCTSCIWPAVLQNSLCVCPVGSFLNASNICQSNSYLILSNSHSDANDYINITAEMSYEEFTNFPSRVYYWVANSNNPSNTLLSSLNTYLASINGVNISISYEYLEPNTIYTLTCYYNNSVAVNITNSTSFGPLNWLIPEIGPPDSKTIFRQFDSPHYVVFTKQSDGPLLSKYDFKWTIIIGHMTSFANPAISYPTCGSSNNGLFEFKLEAIYKINSLFATTVYVGFDTYSDNFTVSLTKASSIDASRVPSFTPCSFNYVGVNLLWKCLRTHSYQNSTVCSNPQTLFSDLSARYSAAIPSYLSSQISTLSITVRDDLTNAATYNSLTCSTGYYHNYNRECLTTCPATSLFTANGLYCDFKCRPVDFYYPPNSSCFPQCPITYYTYFTSGYKYCGDCLSNCQICTNNTVCLYCSSGYFWNNVSCATTCDATTYFKNTTSRYCQFMVPYEFELLGPKYIDPYLDLTLSLYIFTANSVNDKTVYKWTVSSNFKNDNTKFLNLENFLLTKNASEITIPLAYIEFGIEYNFTIDFEDYRSFIYSKTFNALPKCPKGTYRIFGKGCQGTCVKPCEDCLDNSTCISCFKYASLNRYTKSCEMNSYIKLSGPSVISNCSDLSLSSTINLFELYSFSIAFHWSVDTSNVADNTTINGILSSQNQSLVNIPSGMMTPGVTYIFRAYYINLVGDNINTTLEVICDAFIYPTIEINGGFFQAFYPNKENTILIQSKFSKCSDQTVAYVVAVNQPRLDSYDFVQVNSKVTIPKCSLLPNQTSGLLVSLFFKTKKVEYQLTFYSNSHYDYSFYIDADSNFHPSSKPLNLRAVVTYLDECDMYLGNPFLFSWTCSKKISLTPLNRNCPDPQGIFSIASTNKTLIIPASYLTQGEIYIYTATLQDGDQNKTATIEVEIGPASTLSISILCNEAACIDVYNLDNLPRLSIQSSEPLDPSLKFTWDINTIFDYKSIGKYLFLSKKSSATISESAFNFVVSFSNSSHQGRAKQILSINTPPSSGYLTVKPSTGYALDTLYKISSIGWIDENAPLHYQFSYAESENGSLRILSQPYLHPDYITMLPFPREGDTLYIQVNISDSLSAVTTARITVQVQKKSTTLDSVAAQVQVTMDTLKTIDINQKLNIISIASKMLQDMEPTYESSSGCGRNCSDHGVCQANQTCSCQPGFLGLDCSVTNSTMEVITSSKLKMLSMMSQSISYDKENDDLSLMVLNSINDMTQNPGYVNRTVIDSIENILESTMDLLNTTVNLDTAERENVMNITSNLVSFLSVDDCGCNKPSCQAYSTKMNNYLDRVSSFSLEAPDVNNPSSCQTPLFEYKIIQASICDLANLEIGDSKDIVTLIPNSASYQCSKIVGVKYLSIASREEIFSCGDQGRRFLQDSNANKSTKMGVSVIDMKSKADLTDKFSLNIKNPSSKLCPEGCDLSSSGEVTICSCPKAVEFDPKKQIRNIFASSDLVKIQNIGALLDWNPLTSPVFWFDFVILSWYFASYIILARPKILEFDLTSKYRGTDTSLRRAFILTYLEENSMCNIFLFKHDKLSKRLRCTLFCFRIVLFGFFNSAFLSMMKQQDLLEQISNFQLFILMLPYWTMLPVKLAIEGLLSCIDKKMQSAKNKKRFAILFPLISNLLILIFMFLTIIIAANNSTSWEISWLTKLCINIVADLLVSPFVAILIKYADYRHRYFIKKKNHFDFVEEKKESAKIFPIKNKNEGNSSLSGMNLQDKTIMVEEPEGTNRKLNINHNNQIAQNLEEFGKNEENINLTKKKSMNEFESLFVRNMN